MIRRRAFFIDYSRRFGWVDAIITWHFANGATVINYYPLDTLGMDGVE